MTTMDFLFKLQSDREKRKRYSDGWMCEIPQVLSCVAVWLLGVSSWGISQTCLDFLTFFAPSDCGFTRYCFHSDAIYIKGVVG